MLLDVLIAAFVGMIVMMGLFDLSAGSQRLNNETEQLLMANAALIDLEGLVRIHDPLGGAALVVGADICVEQPLWLSDWCKRIKKGFGVLYMPDKTLVSFDGVQFNAKMTISSLVNPDGEVWVAHWVWPTQ